MRNIGRNSSKSNHFDTSVMSKISIDYPQFCQCVYLIDREYRSGKTFIDIIIIMEPAKERQEWYDNLPLDTGEEDERGETIWISYDDSKEVAKLR